MTDYDKLLTEAQAARGDLERAEAVLAGVAENPADAFGRLTAAASILTDARRVVNMLVADINNEVKNLRNGRR